MTQIVLSTSDNHITHCSTPIWMSGLRKCKPDCLKQSVIHEMFMSHWKAQSFFLFCERLSGTTLITVGEYQRRLGGAEREFLHTSAINFLTPLRNFLEGDWKTISVSEIRNISLRWLFHLIYSFGQHTMADKIC